MKDLHINEYGTVILDVNGKPKTPRIISENEVKTLFNLLTFSPRESLGIEESRDMTIIKNFLEGKRVVCVFRDEIRLLIKLMYMAGLEDISESGGYIGYMKCSDPDWLISPTGHFLYIAPSCNAFTEESMRDWYSFLNRKILEDGNTRLRLSCAMRVFDGFLNNEVLCESQEDYRACKFLCELRKEWKEAK